MKHDDQLRYLTMLYWLGGEDHSAIVDWFHIERVENPEPHYELRELLKPNRERSLSVLLEIAETQYGFQPASLAGETIAKTILKEHLERFLAGEIAPVALCSIAIDIDNSYLDTTPADDGVDAFDVRWLGDLYNACDWCDESWTQDSAPHLVTEAERVLANLHAADNCDDSG